MPIICISQTLFFPLPVNERYDTEFKKPKKNTFLFNLLFVCLFVMLFSLLIKISFVCLLSFFSSFLSSSLPSNERYICTFFLQTFQGFTLVPWQKVGRIWLGFAGNPSSFPISPLFACISRKFFPSLSLYIRTIWHRSENL